VLVCSFSSVAQPTVLDSGTTLRASKRRRPLPQATAGRAAIEVGVMPDLSNMASE